MKTLKTAFLLTALTLLLLFIGDAFGGRSGMTLALVFAILMNGTAYFFSDKIALMSSHAQPISREQSPRLYAVMERLAAKANLPMPKLYMIPQPAPNAFATGRNPSHASVAVTQGLIQLMDDEELEGVIAHELSHVRNYDILTSSIAATIAGAVTWVARMGFWFGGGGRNRNSGGLIALLTLIFAPLGALLLQLRHLAPARISGGRFGRKNGRPSLRPNSRARKARGLQPKNPFGHSAFHGCPVHCGAHERSRILCQAVQHASTPRGAHCRTAEYDDHQVTRAAAPARRYRYVSREPRRNLSRHVKFALCLTHP